jgi:hypothetical protein
MGEWITPQELYEVVAQSWKQEGEGAWFRLTVPWEQAGPATKERFIQYAMEANKHLHVIMSQQEQLPAKTKKRYQKRKGRK